MMNWKRVVVLLMAAIGSVGALAQAVPFSAGFRSPIEVTFTNGGNLLVVESGNGPNNGRLSLVDRATGARRTFIESLPSGIHQGPTNAPSGPSAVALQGNVIYLLISNGDSVIPGTVPGTEILNPAPSSPIFSTLLELRTDRPLDSIAGPFQFELSHHAIVDSGETAVLVSPSGEEVSIRLIVDFPDAVPEPRPGAPEHVRLSNPFGIEIVGQTLFVADASLNLIRRVDARTGAYSTLTTFANFPNPIMGVGGPFVESVPNALRIRGNDLLVTTLTGFPFPAGKAEIHRVSLDGNSNTTLVSGLSSALDLRPLGSSPDSPIAVIEFSTNQIAGAPGRLRVVSPTADPVTLVEGLITPTGLAVDQHTGEIFITLLGPGLVMRVNAAASIPRLSAPASIPVAGTTAGAFGSMYTTTLQIANPFSFPIAGHLVFRPQGFSDGHDEASIAYSLAPFESQRIGDLGMALGVDGIGALDVEAPVGQLPEMVATITGTTPTGTSWIHVPTTDSSEILSSGERGVLITPDDPAAARMNIGIRTFSTPASMEISRYDAGGGLVDTVVRSVEANTFVQMSAASILESDLQAGDLLSFMLTEGSALIYGTTTDNGGTGMRLSVASAVAEN